MRREKLILEKFVAIEGRADPSLLVAQLTRGNRFEQEQAMGKIQTTTDYADSGRNLSPDPRQSLGMGGTASNFDLDVDADLF